MKDIDVSAGAAIYDRHTGKSRWGKKKSDTVLMAQQSDYKASQLSIF